jgi:putative transposase
MAIDLKLIDRLLAEHGHRSENIAGEKGLLRQLTKALLERAIQAELTDHLGYEKHDPAGYKNGNMRNGKSKKKLKGDFGQMEVKTPRERNASFEPKILAKVQTRWTGFDDKILSMYARGMTTREIGAHLEEIYGVEVSPTLISMVRHCLHYVSWKQRKQVARQCGRSMRRRRGLGPERRSGCVPA